MQSLTSLVTHNGSPLPLGCVRNGDFINFALYASEAKSVHLCLYHYDNQTHQANLWKEIALDPEKNKTGQVWHISLFAQPIESMLFAYKILQVSHNQEFIVLDPYATEIVSGHEWGKLHALLPGTISAYQPLCAIPSKEPFDWGDDKPPQIPMQDLVIYEMHVRGFTEHVSSKVANPGTFLGVIEKIPHLLELGINAVELLPVHEFNELEYAHTFLPTKTALYNYWGYSTVAFFALMNRYGSSSTPRTATTEFKQMVKELHKNGIEVILDVVYNHTAEAGTKGPCYSFRPLAEDTYYMQGEQGYLDFTGCGNTVNSNQPVVQDLICDSLRYWVTEMHVDGFRFDLASIFTRDTNGQPLANPPLIDRITADPILSSVKLIAEPWDAVGLYQVGNFPGHEGRWAEWNGKYRDSVRRFIKGTPRTKGEFATRICGSEDLYGNDRKPYHSINFITSHDGFSLADLVSYNTKHNLNNGENNRDGFNDNESWNCGVEGITSNKQILALREQQMRNFHLALMISQGVPMLLMGDEYGHRKKGNNNTWCQDNTLNWFLWDQLEAHKGFYRFYRLMNQFRKNTPCLRRTEFLKKGDIEWHGQQPLHPLWDKDNRLIAFTLYDESKAEDLYIAFNACDAEVRLTLPETRFKGMQWYGIVNTHLESPYDIVEESQAKVVKSKVIAVAPHSAILLKAKATLN